MSIVVKEGETYLYLLLGTTKNWRFKQKVELKIVFVLLQTVVGFFAIPCV